MKWMIEEARLGADQKEIIEEITELKGKPIWIQGYAGSGKSVVLLHALNEYIIINKGANVAVVVFTHSLVDLLRTGLKQIPSLANRNIPVLTIYQLRYRLNNGTKYDAIFCDEVQDLPLSFLQTIKNSATQIVIAGDATQSIYSNVPWFDERPATKEEISNHIKPVEKTTNTIYRLTKSIVRILKRVFKNMLEEKIQIGKVDSDIRLFRAYSSDEEWDFVWSQIMDMNRNRPNEITAILFFKKDDIVEFINHVLISEGNTAWTTVYKTINEKQEYDFDNLNRHLDNSNVPIMYVGNKHGSLTVASSDNKIIIMTYHSAKGLDFDAVCLPSIQTDLGSTANQNALILVALSRAKRDLLITYTGEICIGFMQFLEDTPSKDVTQNESGNSQVPDLPF